MGERSRAARLAGIGAMGAFAAALAGFPAVAHAATPNAAAPNIAVTVPGLTYNQEPWLAANPRNPNQLAVAYRDGNARTFCGLATSLDGGRTWHSDNLMGPSGRLAAWPKADTLCYEGLVTWGSDGTLYYVAQATITFRTPYSRILIASSRDAGVGWSDPQDVDYHNAADSSQTSGGDWYPRIAADPQSKRIYVAWTQYTTGNRTGNQVVAVSPDGGQTFSLPVTVNPQPQADAFKVNASGTGLSVGSGGVVYASWLDLTKRNAGCTGGTTTTCNQTVPLEVATSTDGARTFGAPVTVDPAIDLGCPVSTATGTARSTCDELHYDRAPEHFSLVASSTPGTAYLAWWGGDPEQPARISFAATHDAGRTWSAPRGLGTLATATADQQYRPEIAVSGAHVDVAYYDVSPAGAVGVYLVRSTDGGATFAEPERMTSAAGNIKVGPNGDAGIPGQGEWLGVAATTAGIDVVWTDTRHGTVDSAAQGIFFGGIQLVAGGVPGWVIAVLVIGGVVVVLAGAGAATLVLRRRSGSVAAPLGASGRRG